MTMMSDKNGTLWLFYGACVGLASTVLFLSTVGFGGLLEGGWPGILILLFIMPVGVSVPAYFGLKRWSAVFYAVYLIGVIIFASILRSAAGAKNLGGAIVMPFLGFLALGYAIAIGIAAGIIVEAIYQIYRKLEKGRPSDAIPGKRREAGRLVRR